MRFLSFFLFVAVFLLGLGVFYTPVMAQGPAEVQLINPLGGSEENPAGIARQQGSESSQAIISELAARIIKGILGLVGSLSLSVFMYGGCLWLTSAGEAAKVKSGWQAMIYASVGLFVIFGAYAILSTVIRGVTS